ncbi:FadR/GntR family transcriptional regulator [Alloyangia pacifica]|uniref:DNA-binding transcriptional regulator, FadR family n=1 Tax=Alloyangia pacifica TaxID=311180 RepID=A0A1I6R001_9RHOB|nr:FadR/GntR family transcriptional regulator [Alloyangia pacifica]SDG07529.1 DNA-binding transcriptional regulator, FadR family [Alloyangia pacifica]SFS57828.1 DNA-binding transcriptional regulator, FadR family [Alloyangia pacifica]
MLTPIVQTPRYRLVAEEIAARIRAGDFAPGAKMPADKDLVARLGVSRTTVREAMIALELMGYVVTRYGAGAFVADPLPSSQEEALGLPGFYELVEARFVIEPEIAAIAASTVTPGQIAQLNRCIEGMCDTRLAFDKIEAHDREFHLVIARSTGNSLFVTMVEDFWHARQRYPEWTRLNNRQSSEDIARFYGDEHVAIVEALSAGDPEAARAAMAQHCRNSGQPLLERWQLLEGEAGVEEVLHRLKARTGQPG